MNGSSPGESRPITAPELNAFLTSEKAKLSSELADFLRSVEIALIRFPCFRDEQHGIEHVFAIARLGKDLLIFDDAEDEFGLGEPGEDGVLRNWVLCGDLIDALRIVRSR